MMKFPTVREVYILGEELYIYIYYLNPTQHVSIDSELPEVLVPLDLATDGQSRNQHHSAPHCLFIPESPCPRVLASTEWKIWASPKHMIMSTARRTQWSGATTPNALHGLVEILLAGARAALHDVVPDGAGEQHGLLPSRADRFRRGGSQLS